MTSAAAAHLRLVPPRPQPRQLSVAADERRRVLDVELVREVDARQREVERGVVAQHGILERAQLGPRLDAEVGGERLPRVAIGVERLCLPAAAIEGDHQVACEPLARGVVRHEPAQLTDDLGVATGREVGLDADLERGLSLLLEPGDLRLGERLEGQVGERRPAPQRECFAQDRGRTVGVPGGQRAAAVLDQPLEALGVELARLHADPVARRRRRHDLAVAERLAQTRDVHLHGAHRAARRLLAPQRERQPLRADRLVGVEEEDGEHRARLRPLTRIAPRSLCTSSGPRILNSIALRGRYSGRCPADRGSGRVG